jgi:photosystem II stability/assembly factor-like uncharacterized protein
MKKIIYVLILYFSLLITRYSISQWVSCQDVSGMGTYEFDTIGNSIYCATFGEGGIYRSTNNGINWTSISASAGFTTFSVSHNNNYIFAAAYQNKAYRTSNNGVNWTQTITGLPTNYSTHAVITKDNYVFLGFFDTNGVYCSTNNGDNWFRTDRTLHDAVFKFAVSGQYLFADCIGGLYRTSNYGTNWQNITSGITDYYGWSICTKGTNLYIAGSVGGGTGGAFFSTNYGNNWSFLYPGVSNIFAYNNYIFIAGGGNFLVSTNNGINWTNNSQGILFSTVSIYATNNFVYAGRFNEPYNNYPILYRRPISNLITGIESATNKIPNKFELYQNYPNPFNPTTKISYKVESYKVIKLIVYDILGKEIETLVNEKQSPGAYEVTFDGSKYASGIYFYQLNAGDFVETRKMILIK